MSHISPQKIPQQAFDWYDDYAHGDIDRRTFLSRLGSLSVAGLTLGAVTSALTPNYALAEQVAPDDKSIIATYKKYASPKGAGVMNAYYVRPAVIEHKLPAVVVIHENRGLQHSM